MEDACSHASTRTELTGDRIYYSHVEYAVDRSFVCAHMESRMNRVITRVYTYIYIIYMHDLVCNLLLFDKHRSLNTLRYEDFDILGNV